MSESDPKSQPPAPMSPPTVVSGYTRDASLIHHTLAAYQKAIDDLQERVAVLEAKAGIRRGGGNLAATSSYATQTGSVPPASPIGGIINPATILGKDPLDALKGKEGISNAEYWRAYRLSLLTRLILALIATAATIAIAWVWFTKGG